MAAITSASRTLVPDASSGLVLGVRPECVIEASWGHCSEKLLGFSPEDVNSWMEAILAALPRST